MVLGLQHIAYHVPEGVVSNTVLCERHGFEEAFIRDKLGIAQRHIAAADESTGDLAVTAAQKLLAETGVAPGDIDCLVVVTQTPDYTLPHTAALVQQRLGLPRDVATFDISLGCSGYVYGLATVLAFMEAQGMEHGLLITAEEYSRLMDEGDRATAPLFGDGAAATLLGPRPRYRLGKAAFGTDGAGAPSLIARGTGSRTEPRQPLYMDGRAIFNFMMTRVPENVAACLERNGLAQDDIDLWVFHQASRYLLTTLAKRMGLDPAKVAIELADVGNTTSSTIPIALARTAFAADPAPARVLICGFGVGLSWGSVVLERAGA